MRGCERLPSIAAFIADVRGAVGAHVFERKADAGWSCLRRAAPRGIGKTRIEKSYQPSCARGRLSIFKMRVLVYGVLEILNQIRVVNLAFQAAGDHAIDGGRVGPGVAEKLGVQVSKQSGPAKGTRKVIGRTACEVVLEATRRRVGFLTFVDPGEIRSLSRNSDASAALAARVKRENLGQIDFGGRG